MAAPIPSSAAADATLARTRELFKEQQQNIIQHTDRLFARLMVLQWLGGILIAFLVSPRVWSGTSSQTHLHVWAAIFLGGAVTSLPVFLALRYPGQALTRHCVAVGQMLMSALLIHLTGGRIETHFHVFGSLAILAFYRDWRVLLSASVVVFLDHLLRGVLWPHSVYGVLSAPIWRSLEHAGWVLFEVAFLVISIMKSLSEMLIVAERQAKLESLKDSIEQTVIERTADLRHEVAERSKAQERLKESQGRLAQAQEIARLGSWEWVAAADRVTWSDKIGRWHGIKEEEAGATLGRFLACVHADDASKIKEALAKALKTGEPYVCDYRLALPDGTQRILHSRGEARMDAAGRPVGIVGTSQDVTEARQTEAALRRAEQIRHSQKMDAVGRLAGGVSHDFNNLLTVIGGYCALLQARFDKSDPLQKIADEIANAADRAKDLTRQLLAFSRKQVLQPCVLDLNQVVSGMEKTLLRSVGEDVELRTFLEASLGKVKADPGQIEQVILNMVVNARDAMPQGGKITINTSNVTLDDRMPSRNRQLAAGEYVMLAISDTGIGMTANVTSHLFEPFFTTKGMDKGSGLGLATCYGIIIQSGGDICVYSEPNVGTTFKIYLPRTNQSAEPPAPKRGKSMPGGTESILVVDDEPAVRKLAVLILSECGYQVQQASNAPEALQVMENSKPFDLVVTDVIMPRMTGKELYDVLRERDPGARVLFMSGYTDDALVHQGVLSAGLSFLEKPFTAMRLACKVRQLLDGRTPEVRLAEAASAALPLHNALTGRAVWPQTAVFPPRSDMRTVLDSDHHERDTRGATPRRSRTVARGGCTLERAAGRRHYVCASMKTNEPKPRVRPNELSQLELDEALKRLGAWALVHRPNDRAKTGQAAELHRKFAFESFEDAMHFMQAASRRMARMDHHPEWVNTYKKVSVWLTTHEIGCQPSALDVELATYLDELYVGYKPEDP